MAVTYDTNTISGQPELSVASRQKVQLFESIILTNKCYLKMSKNPIATTSLGKLEGTWQAKNSIAVFKGVPFAKPPIDNLRWQAPQALDAWQGIKKAQQFGPHAIQLEIFIEKFLGGLVDGQGWGMFRNFFVKTLLKIAPKPKQSEDCLYLNVRTPKLDTTAKLPVMVWIHGGDHQDGSGAEIYYDSNAIPEKGVVVVTINYRLGLMGYFTHPELNQESEHQVSGNYGTLDQIAALQWVKDNIEGFGGDPENVTIFGESAGGESVAHLLNSPLAKGLFHKAILQSPANSGQMMHLSKPFLDYPSGEDRGVAFAKTVGVTGNNQLEKLRKMSAIALQKGIQAQDELSGFYPVIDGYVLPKSNFETFEDGKQHPVPVLLGSNSDEGTLIHAMFPTPLIAFRYRRMEDSQLPAIFYEEYAAESAKLLELYPGLETRDTKAEQAFLGDDMSGGKTRFYAEKITQTNQPAFLYHFNRTPPSPKQTAGAFHAAELPLVHVNHVPILLLDQNDLKLSAIMINYWTQFAKTGNPNGINPQKWEAFNPNQPNWMVLGTK
ncbi:MAG: carboxylesterase/lipase family protein, partial [Saprospiraceae bacterium]